MTVITIKAEGNDDERNQQVLDQTLEDQKLGGLLRQRGAGIDDIERERKAWEGLQMIHAWMMAGADDDGVTDLSAADICEELFALMNNLGLEVS